MCRSDPASEQMLRKELFGRRVLMLEDQPEFSSAMIAQLKRYDVARIDVFTTGEAARDAALANRYDVLLLDRKNPGIDGLEALRQIRAGPGPSALAPALMITSSGEPNELTEGLIHGADDYVVKPPDELELIARIAAQIRGSTNRSRLAGMADGLLVNGPLTIDMAAKTVSLRDEPLPLTGKTFSILEVLARSIGLTITNSMLLRRCWPSLTVYTDGWSNMVYQRVHQLSKALHPFERRLLPPAVQPVIVNVRGEGYYMRDLSSVI